MLTRFFANGKHARKPGRPRVVFALMVVVALFAVFPLAVAAQNAPHVIFTGKGFIDGQVVVDGTVVEAWISGRPVAATKIFGSEYQLYIEEPPGESFEGAVIRFKLQGYRTDAIAGWIDGTDRWLLLYAYTGRQGYPDDFSDDWTPKTAPDDAEVIRQYQIRLLELEQMRSEMAAEYNRELKIDIANVTNRWEGAIAELRADVEREIQQVEREFEWKRQQISLGPRREAMLSELDAELDAFIRDKWAEFEVESGLKQRYLNEEIREVSQVKDSALNDIGQTKLLIISELKKRLARMGIPFEFYPLPEGIKNPGDGFWRPEGLRYPVDGFQLPEGLINLVDGFKIPDDLKNPLDILRVPEDPKTPVISVAPHPSPAPDGVVDLFTPGTPTPGTPVPKEPERNRGFFTNSISVDPGGLNQALDPTALAVIGILITLAATAVQLVKGN